MKCSYYRRERVGLIALLLYSCSPLTEYRTESVSLAQGIQAVGRAFGDDGARWLFMAPVDMNGDGAHELLATRNNVRRSGNDVVLLGERKKHTLWEGTGVLGASWVVVNDAAPRLIVLFDPNRDIEERPQGHAIRIAYSRCTVESEPVCVPEGELEAPGSGTFVMGDIDDDGVEDIVSADGERIFIHRGEQPDHDQVSWGPREPLGEAAVHSLRNVWPWVNALSVADLDDDGLTDVIAIDGSRIAIFFGNQAAGSEDAQFLMTAENSLLLRFHIASTSERLDLIAETESGIVVFRNTGNRTFESMAVDTDVPSDTDSVSPIIKGTFTGMGRVELFVYPRGADAHVIAFDRDYTWNVVDVALPFTGGGVDEYGDVTALDIDADGMDEIVRSWVAFQDGCS